MGGTKINSKALSISNDNLADDLVLINQHSVKELTADDVYTFKIILCDNVIDRVYDKMSDKFLYDFAEYSKGLTGLKDHDWESDNQLARLYDTEVVDDLEQPGRKYVLGKAYTLRKYQDYIDKINAGLLKEVSVSFDSINDTCSICGGITHKNDNDIAVCENNHIAGVEYDGVLCYNSLNEFKDSYEWSLVAVPCQRNSGIKNKNIDDGGKSIMKKSMFMLQKLLNSKAFKEADEDTKKALKEAVDVEEDADLSEEEVKNLVAENAKLKEEIDSLKERVKAAESGRTMDKVESIVSKSIDEMNPLTPVVKENIMKEIDLSGLKLSDDGSVEGIEDIMSNLKERYKGLINIEAEKIDEVHEDIGKQDDVHEEDAMSDEDDEINGIEKASEDETLETLKKKSVRHNSGISFGVNTNQKSVKSGGKSGRTFN